MTTDSTADGHVTPEPPELNKSNDTGSRRCSGSKTTWERALYMLLFGFIGYFTFWVIVLIALVQLVVTLVAREPNEDLQSFSRNLAEYIKQIAAWLGFVSDEKPCPFSPFPKVEADVGAS